MNVSAGDTLVCKQCNNKRTITQTWLDGLMRRYYPTAAGKAIEIEPKVVARLACSACGSKSMKVLQATADSGTHAYILCPACGGDGGIEGKCYKCFGTGFRPDEESNS